MVTKAKCVFINVHVHSVLLYTKFELTCLIISGLLAEVFWLLCIVYVIRAQPAKAALVAQLVRVTPRKWTVVASSST